MRRIGLVASVLAVALAAAPAAASAHPLGNFSVNHYAALVVAPDAIEIDLVIDTAEIPTLDAIARLDADGDGTVDPGELAAARAATCETAQLGLQLALDGRAVPLVLTAAGLQLRPGAAGLDTLRMVCELRGELAAPIGPSVTLTFADRGDAERLGWREIVVRGDRVAIGTPDAGTDVSARLTRYPADLLDVPLRERATEVAVRAGGPALVRSPIPDAQPLDAARTTPGTAAAAVLPGAETPWSVDLRDLSPPVAALGLLLALLAGAGHALSPGHGKTLMAAYLVGSSGRPRDALVLGLAVTASHTAGVVALAIAILAAGSALAPERLYPILSGISGMAVLAIGAFLLAGCIRRRYAPPPRPHDHDHPHPHAHPHPHPHPRSRPGRGGLLLIGLAGGLVPSTAALVLLLGAVAAGQPAYGFGLAVAFGIGMASALIAVGLVVVRGRERMAGLAARLPLLARAAPVVPWAAALVVIAGGAALTGQALVARL